MDELLSSFFLRVVPRKGETRLFRCFDSAAGAPERCEVSFLFCFPFLGGAESRIGKDAIGLFSTCFVAFFLSFPCATAPLPFFFL